MFPARLLHFHIEPSPSLPGVFVSNLGAAYRRLRDQPNVYLPRKPYLSAVGYFVVGATDAAGRKAPRYLHRLVAELFLRPPNPGEEVRHLDGTRTNNCHDNLAWGTRLENCADARRHGTIPRGTSRPNAILNDDLVRQIRAMLGEGVSQKHVAARLALGTHLVSDVASSACWGHVV